MAVLNPMSGFPALGSGKGTGNPQGIWPWRPAGFNYRFGGNWTVKKAEHQRISPIFVKVMSPTSGFPAWGSDKRTGNPQGIWTWRPVGFDCKTFTGPGVKETPVLEGTNKTLYSPNLRGKDQWHQRRLNQNYLLGFNSTWTENFQMYKLDLEKAKESEIKLSTPIAS